MQQPFVLMLNNSDVVWVFVIRPSHSNFGQAKKISRRTQSWEDDRKNQNQITHNKLPYRIEPTDLGSSGKPKHEGRSHHEVFLDTGANTSSETMFQCRS